jgi:hypothetical protein
MKDSAERSYFESLQHCIMSNMRNAYNILFGKRKGKRQFGRPRRRWEDIILDLKGIW